MIKLDPAAIDLSGYTLVEASAGTGKTHTITSLYLRLILELGLSTRDILVVTYTRAATEELRYKIRKRLRSARSMLAGSPSGLADEFLRELTERLDSSGMVGRRQMILRLEEAILCLDEAAIFTIHSFCQRMLREFAFESSSPFNAEVLPSEQEILKAACAEFVRMHFYSSDTDFMKWVGHILDLKDLPAGLERFLRLLWRLPRPEIIHPCSIEGVKKEAEDLKRGLQRAAETIEKADLKALKKAIISLCTRAAVDLSGFLRSRGLSDELVEELEKSMKKQASQLLTGDTKILTAIPDKATDSFFHLPDLMLYDLSVLGSWHFMDVIMENLLPWENWRKGKKLKKLVQPVRKSFEELYRQWMEHKRTSGPPEGFRELTADPVLYVVTRLALTYRGINQRLLSAILVEGRDFIKDFSGRWKKARSVITYDDMLVMLSDALVSRPRGPGLARRLAARFKAALIDEFQDTDRIQWEIFRAVFSDPHNCRLFLIGDPKQAIYGFRGADIFTYLDARNMVPENRRYSLDTNWRSSPPLIQAVNTIFQDRKEATFLLEGIEFVRVNPRPDFEETLETGGGEDSCAVEIQLFFDDRKGHSGQFEDEEGGRAVMEPATHTALEIKRLVAEGRRGRAFFLSAKGRKRHVTPGDITVLVRDFVEAGKIRDELYRLGIPSVYYGPGSVFNTDEARHILYMLNAVENPSDTTAVSTALGTLPLGFSATEIYALQRKQARWDAMVEKFSDLRDLWTKDGVFPMLRSLFQQFDVPKKLLGLKDGERRLTNLRQISEMLSDAERDHPGMHRLILWLRENMESPDDNSDDQKLRLETDENLVTIMSYHRSKGLEFPILFLPFLDQIGLKKRKDPAPVLYSRTHNGYICPLSHKAPSEKDVDLWMETLGENKQGLAGLDWEDNHWWKRELEIQKQAELVRLIYVALTRARYKVYFGFSSRSAMCLSTLGNIMFGHLPRQTLEEEQAGRLLDGLFNGQEQVRIFYPGESALKMEELLSIPCLSQEKKMPFPPPVPARQPLAPRVWAQASFSSLTRLDNQYVHSDWVSSEQMDMEDVEAEMDIFSFPRGPLAGNCVHKLFEIIDFHGRAHDFLGPSKQVLERFGLEERWAGILAGMADSVMRTCIGRGIMLGRLDNAWISREMGFVWPFPPGETGTLVGLREHDQGGVFKGFIDLVFRHGDRFYVLDYKTNWLGSSLEDYAEAALQEAMEEHNYWLQAGIYAAALERYLASGLYGYEFERHFGGIFYLFIRGVRPERGADYGVKFISPDEIRARYPELFRATAV